MAFRNAAVVLFCSLAMGSGACADAITDWNETACDASAKLGPGAPGHRAMAVVQVAVFEAVNAIEPRYQPYLERVPAPPGASVDAAVAAANRSVLMALIPAEKAAVESAYRAALQGLPDGAAKADGIAVGEKAAALVLARAAADGANGPDNYQWQTVLGRYVPTVIPAAPTWPRRKPWIMDSASQFRPGPPPDLASETWARDLQEVRLLGGRNSTARSAAQTDIARFWEETRPLVYHPLLRAVARMPGRSVTQNARLYAAASMAMDDALIAVFDAKYTYNFWRPITAIRIEHQAGHAKSEADLGWTPLIPTPMHPEYPCAHCVVSGALGAVIREELQGQPPPRLSSTSPAAPGMTREWGSVDAFMEEVRLARIYDGVHYRNSTVEGSKLGMAVGRLVQQRFGAPAGGRQ
ncbi:vanadium-dependent haloperoxidase [Roseateles saccharophilus]|uniref:PAP2 superfamily protein n=1 Tax=Roseateles saccharophilus TaxID=304 RepID=A0A4R3US80_ROSSA|nr:vanadium-dependent haloperoxidase [Roseateles saccharophilus]MDG0833681.1 phosphatase PAP2 family protein [Roseateles saccharophilus]TCU93268.1 PAP2 superfamily protein [Roseateles saccharophilus]